MDLVLHFHLATAVCVSPVSQAPASVAEGVDVMIWYELVRPFLPR
ncbi:hypothetical protein E2C01_056032 [Portunus trituberculatus]|uniref:Uncharacterized protein n=1 Tax=Portunus trituberculatus TaxID=210409 RepID=A0A5B7GWB0_PORTR|nr:hypothetical protein [Portunus trituberculatus]